MQQDTVLQHSRMYGYRGMRDLSVTRFYTTIDIYYRMAKMNEFDTKLREDFEQGNFEKVVVFISKDEQGKIIPCSPQKIRISNTHVLKSSKTVLPIGFQTDYKSYTKKHIAEIDDILKSRNNGKLDGDFKITKEESCKIIELIYNTLKIEGDNCIDRDAFMSILNYLSTSNVNVHCRTNRNMSRLRKTDRYYQDMPYSGADDLKKAKEMATT